MTRTDRLTTRIAGLWRVTPAALLLALGIGGCTGSADVAETAESPPPPEGAVRLLALGNSITQGDAQHLTYRYPLWRRLVDAGIDVDFVGSLREHFSETPAYPPYADRTFDPDHEGHWGWRVDEILDGRGSGGLEAWLASYDPDVVLLHLGTNDVFQEQSQSSTLSELRRVVELLRADSPQVAILWALLIPTTNLVTTADIASLNAAVQTLAAELDSSQSPIRMVDLHSGFDAAAMTYDGVHPNEAGEEWMAERWFVALQAVLPAAGS